MFLIEDKFRNEVEIKDGLFYVHFKTCSKGNKGKTVGNYVSHLIIYTKLIFQYKLLCDMDDTL